MVVAVFCLTWLGALWLWQKQGREVSQSDLVIYLGLLPLVIVLFIVGFRWAWAAALNSALARVGGANAGSGNTAAMSPNVATNDEKERGMTSVVLAAAVNTVAGIDPGELLDAGKSGKPLPAPDESLTDDSGLPILSARCKGIVDGAWSQDLVALVTQVAGQQPDWRTMEPRIAVWRSLSLMTAPLVNVREALLALLQAQHNAKTLNKQHAEASERQPVRVLLGVSETTSEFERACLLAWVNHLMLDDWPPETSEINLSVTYFQGAPEGFLLKIDQILLSLRREKRNDLLIAAAAESLLDDAAVGRLSDQGRLYQTDERPAGVMPGEAAAVLLLGGIEWASSEESENQTALIHRLSITRRDKSIEAAGKGTCAQLVQVMQDALAVSSLSGGDIASMVCDADQHTQRATELFGGTLDQLPDLDPVEDFRLLGRVTGSVGMSSMLVSMAAGAEMVSVTNKPCMVVGLADLFVRVGCVLRPAAGR